MDKNETPESESQPQPAVGILAVPIMRHETDKAPNRANRNRFFREAAVFKLGDNARKLRVLMYKTEPQLLFVMPDGVVYEANARMMIEHVVDDWQTPAEPEAPDEPATEVTTDL